MVHQGGVEEKYTRTPTTSICTANKPMFKKQQQQQQQQQDDFVIVNSVICFRSRCLHEVYCTLLRFLAQKSRVSACWENGIR